MKKIFKQDLKIYKRGETHHLKWTVKNLTEYIIPLKQGMALLDEIRPSVHPRFKPLEWNPAKIIEPKQTIIILDQILHPDRVDNYRFNFEAYHTIGIEDTNHQCYYVTEKQRKNIIKQLNKLSDRELPQAWYLTKTDTDKQLNEALAGNGISSIVEIFMEEGYNPDPINNPNTVQLDKL